MAVYFIQAGDGGPIKIGFTEKSVAHRFSKMRADCPEPISLLAVVTGDRATELSIHQRFVDSRLRGEWFSPTPGLVEFIATVDRSIEDQRQPLARSEMSKSHPSITAILKQCGGSEAVADATGVTTEAVRKWPRNGIPEKHWADIQTLAEVSINELYEANKAARNRQSEAA